MVKPRGSVAKASSVDEVCPVWDDEQEVFVWAYTLTGAAKQLKMPVQKVRELVHLGQLPEYRKSHHKGRRIFILKSEVEKFLGQPPTDPIAHI